jgi:hypothetical protein
MKRCLKESAPIVPMGSQSVEKMRKRVVEEMSPQEDETSSGVREKKSVRFNEPLTEQLNNSKIDCYYEDDGYDGELNSVDVKINPDEEDDAVEEDEEENAADFIMKAIPMVTDIFHYNDNGSEEELEDAEDEDTEIDEFIDDDEDAESDEDEILALFDDGNVENDGDGEYDEEEGGGVEGEEEELEGNDQLFDEVDGEGESLGIQSVARALFDY